MGIIFAFIAALGWGTDSVLARQGLRALPPALATAISLSASLIVCLIAIMIIGPANFPPAGYAWFGMIGLINFLLGRQFNFRATKRLGAARTASLLATSPLVSIALTVLINKEQITPQILLGVLLSVTGVILVVGG